MPAAQHSPLEAASPANGQTAAHDLFALTDEQILEIEPDVQDVALRGPVTNAATEANTDSQIVAISRNESSQAGSPDAAVTNYQSSSASQALAPPAWLAAQMKDPWTGEEAKELWNGNLQARKEAADYRAAIATPEDARALKELYPGGVNEARSVAERARAFDDIDRAYFGSAGNSAEQTSAGRAQLAARMMREDPAAFREMVFAGLRALEQSGARMGTDAGAHFSATSAGVADGAAQTPGGLKSAFTNAAAPAPTETHAREHEARMAAYASFEKAANEDLERSVGATIDRALHHALPNIPREGTNAVAGAQPGAPLHARLTQAIRQDVEAALKGDRQLGEQVAQILSGRRLDAETRAQVVRLIGERAQQLVPTAAKRVLNDWTQTTLATHRSQSGRADAASGRREVAPAASSAVPARSTGRQRIAEFSENVNRARSFDYRKLSDEQILDL